MTKAFDSIFVLCLRGSEKKQIIFLYLLLEENVWGKYSKMVYRLLHCNNNYAICERATTYIARTATTKEKLVYRVFCRLYALC